MPKKKETRNADSYELDQVDEAYRNLSGKKKKMNSKKKKSSGSSRMVKVIIILVAVLVACLCTVAALHLFGEVLAPETIPENVTVAGVDIGGLEREEATPVVTQAVEAYYANKDMVVTVGETVITIPAETIGPAVDVEAILDAAFALNETEDPAASTVIELAPYLSLNEYGISNALLELETYYPTEVIEHSWEVVDEASTEATEATEAETEETAPEKNLKLKITIGKSAFALDVNAISEAVIGQIYKSEFAYTTSIEQVDPQPLDIDAIYNQYCTQAVDAMMDPETFEVSDHVYGYSFNLDSAKEAIATAKPGDELEFPFETIAPSVTKESLSGLLFRDVLAS